jgi:putative membrane protein
MADLLTCFAHLRWGVRNAGERGPGFLRTHRFLIVLISVYGTLWIGLAFAPRDRAAWVLENLLVVFFVGALVFTFRRFTFSNRSYFLITLFLSLHAVGAHYTYAQTPFGEWLKEAFDLSRNHFDRIIHFSFGLLMAYPAREVLLRLGKVDRLAALWLTVATVLAASTLFEIVEAMAAETVSPGEGPQWLGGQGDVWDAQSDMVLALIGAAVAMLLTWSRGIPNSRKTHGTIN